MRTIIICLGRKKYRGKKEKEREAEVRGEKEKEKGSVGLTCITGNVPSQKSLTWTKGTIAILWQLP